MKKKAKNSNDSKENILKNELSQNKIDLNELPENSKSWTLMYSVEKSKLTNEIWELLGMLMIAANQFSAGVLLSMSILTIFQTSCSHRFNYNADQSCMYIPPIMEGLWLGISNNFRIPLYIIGTIFILNILFAIFIQGVLNISIFNYWDEKKMDILKHSFLVMLFTDALFYINYITIISKRYFYLLLLLIIIIFISIFFYVFIVMNIL